MKEEGLRYNDDKLRYDLLHPVAQKGLVQVLTFGATKYAERNWEKGMKWSKVLASLKRHLAAIENGEDYDQETGLLHADHLQCNAHFLSTYYHTHKEHDDRPKKFFNIPKIGLDIDDVICDFVPAFMAKFNLNFPENWYWSYETEKHFKYLIDHPDEMNEFYLNLPPKIDARTLKFEPHCYITSRSLPEEITKKWIEKNNFSCKPVYTVPFQTSKIEVALKSGIEIFVDDRYENFAELNNNGILCYLLTTEWNKRYDVGHFRINNLNDILV